MLGTHCWHDRHLGASTTTGVHGSRGSFDGSSPTDFVAVVLAPSVAVNAPPADDVSVVAWQLPELKPPDTFTRQLLAMAVSAMANHRVAGVDIIQDTVQQMIR